MRARITADPGYDNRVTLSWYEETTDGDGLPNGGVRRVEREFHAPFGGGYVSEGWNNPRQVCDGLGRFGNTLLWSGTYPLVELIRVERRRQLRREAY